MDVGRAKGVSPVGWAALDGGDVGQSAAMSHGMARIRLDSLEQVLWAFLAGLSCYLISR